MKKTIALIFAAVLCAPLYAQKPVNNVVKGVRNAEKAVVSAAAGAETAVAREAAAAALQGKWVQVGPISPFEGGEVFKMVSASSLSAEELEKAISAQVARTQQQRIHSVLERMNPTLAENLGELAEENPELAEGVGMMYEEMYRPKAILGELTEFITKNHYFPRAVIYRDGVRVPMAEMTEEEFNEFIVRGNVEWVIANFPQNNYAQAFANLKAWVIEKNLEGPAAERAVK